MMASATRRPKRKDRTKHILRALQILAGVTACAAAFLAWRESRPFTLQLQPSSVRSEAFLGTAERPAHFYELESRFARRARIDACVQNWTSVNNDAYAEPGTPRAQLDACINLIKRNLSIAPASSNDWLIAAILSNSARDRAATTRYLKRSIATGPTEQWIAERRAPLMFQLEDELDDELQAEIDSQLALMLRTDEGIRSLARIYLKDPEFRERIVSVAETLEQVYQKRFLVYVRRWASQIGKPAEPAPPPS